MPKPNAELKARLKAEADAAIEEWLAHRKAPAQASLADDVAIYSPEPDIELTPKAGHYVRGT